MSSSKYVLITQIDIEKVRSRTKLAYERSDVSLLSKWIDEMIAQAKELNEELPFLSLYMDIASIYTGAISELVRQISIHSKD